MSHEVLSLQRVGKSYRDYPAQRHRFLSWFGLEQKSYRDNWVLRDISLSVRDGEAVGIVGVNGAGKSTLLRIIAGTLAPTTGTVTVHGKISAILELGMGFNQDLSARANVLHACGLMGYGQQEILVMMDEIESFVEIGDYFDQPLRTFSSGMQMRVAFAAATAFRPEILIVDEALSVGDAYFQHKSAARIRQFKEQGTTLLFVSHDPGAVKSLCNRALLFDGGELVHDGKPDAVLDYYNAVIARKEVDAKIRQLESNSGRITTRSGNGRARIIAVDMLDNTGSPSRSFQVGDQATLRCHIRYHQPVSHACVGFLLRDRLGNDVFGTNTFHLGQALPEAIGDCVVDFKLCLSLGYGSYSITVAAHSEQDHVADNHDWWDNVLAFAVLPGRESRFIGTAFVAADAILQKDMKTTGIAPSRIIAENVKKTNW